MTEDPRQQQNTGPAEKVSADCYSEGKRTWMEWGQRM